MGIYKKTLAALCYIFLLSTTNIALANSEESSVEFFASNNTREINLQAAYARLTSKEQVNLQETMIKVIQKNHIEQGTFKEILGTYHMSKDQNITADNTEIFITSPYQHLSDEKVFTLAKRLANTLKQESVAVFITSKEGRIGDITLNFDSYKPSLVETINLLHEKLPPLYNQAFSLQLQNDCAGFKNARVSQIEWLGSKINLDKIKKAFPKESIAYHYGKVFLIYRDGQKQRI